jgi:AraC family transcriptional regulator of adaptative response / DNA-3-methyladenine glycosylase II
MLARDVRFDGRIFTAVRTTGIYCRPICPTPPPKRVNCTWYPTAAAAQSAGFRPCLRCRPELAPGLDRRSYSTLARRAVAIMDENPDDQVVGMAASRLGVSARTLHRAFLREFGASPKDVHATKRALLAKGLIVDSSLSLAEVAFAAGYGSIRRFNASFQKLYGRPPGALRRSEQRDASSKEAGIVIKLPYREPYAHRDLIGFLETRAIPGVEAVRAGVWSRTFDLAESVGVIEISNDADRSQLIARIWLDDVAKIPVLRARLMRLFDVESDPAAIDAVLSVDTKLAGDVASRPGVRLPGAWDGFEIAVRAVLGQQISVSGARTLAARIAERHGTAVTMVAARERGLERTFPAAKGLVEAPLEGLGIMPLRARTIRDVARVFVETPDLLSAAWPTEEVIARLEAVRGIGPWTSAYITLRGIGDPDRFPPGDLGLRQALDGADEKRATAAWRPWRSYAAIRLWTMPQHQWPTITRAQGCEVRT